jgi:hypothetical protein
MIYVHNIEFNRLMPLSKHSKHIDNNVNEEYDPSINTNIEKYK